MSEEFHSAPCGKYVLQLKGQIFTLHRFFEHNAQICQIHDCQYGKGRINGYHVHIVRLISMLAHATRTSQYACIENFGHFGTHRVFSVGGEAKRQQHRRQWDIDAVQQCRYEVSEQYGGELAIGPHLLENIWNSNEQCMIYDIWIWLWMACEMDDETYMSSASSASKDSNRPPRSPTNEAFQWAMALWLNSPAWICFWPLIAIACSRPSSLCFARESTRNSGCSDMRRHLYRQLTICNKRLANIQHSKLIRTNIWYKWDSYMKPRPGMKLLIRQLQAMRKNAARRQFNITWQHHFSSTRAFWEKKFARYMQL